MVAIFPKLCLWRRSLCSNLVGIGPEKLYRATLILFYILRLCPRRWDKGAGWSTIPLRLRFFNPKLILLFYTKVKESEE